MKKLNVLNQLMENGVVAVIRGKSKEDGLRQCDALIKGELVSLEVAYTTPGASEIIAELKINYQDRPDVLVGAGTVLDEVSARLAIAGGADFVVSPSFDKKVAEMCNLYQVPYLPGCMTITEINTALKTGVDIIKVFPGDIVGSRFIKDVKGPLPYVNLMPTGGVSLENMEEWFDNGVVAVGVGGNLTKGLTHDNYEVVTENAQAYIAKLKEIRGK